MDDRGDIDVVLSSNPCSAQPYIRSIAIFIFSIIVLGLAYGFGGVVAMDNLATQRYEYMLTTKEGPRCVKLLRAGSEIILVQEENGSVSVIPNSQVELLRRIGDLPRDPLLTLDEFRAWLSGEREQPKVSPQCLERT